MSYCWQAFRSLLRTVCQRGCIHVHIKCVNQLGKSLIERVYSYPNPEQWVGGNLPFLKMVTEIPDYLEFIELNNWNRIFAEFHDSSQYISVFLWINSVGSSMVEDSLPSKINLNADFVYQIEFMHKAMCTYIFVRLRAITAFSSSQLCHTFFKTLVFMYCA